jgi:hypothetical protein
MEQSPAFSECSETRKGENFNFLPTLPKTKITNPFVQNVTYL